LSVTIKTLALAILLAGGGFFLWWQGNSSHNPDITQEREATTITPAKNESTSQASQDPVSPFGAVEADSPSSTDPTPQTSVDVSSSPATTSVQQTEPLLVSDEALATEAYELGKTSLSDAQILDYINRLKTDPAFVDAVANEFRSETDPDRLRRLSYLLGQVQDPSLTVVANDMVYSSNRESQLAGLELLKYLQPHAPEARDAVKNILSSDADPEMLVRTINVLALPAEATESDRQSMVSHLSPLTSDSSPLVRQSSMSMIALWASDTDANDVLVSGLRDEDESVRKAVAYATIKTQDASPELIEALLTVLEDPNELPSARSGAKLSLSKKQLSETDRLRLEAVSAKLR